MIAAERKDGQLAAVESKGQSITISAAGPAFRITGDNLEDLKSRVPKLAAEYSERLGYVPSQAAY